MDRDVPGTIRPTEIPRWLDALAVILMVVLLASVLLLLFGYVTAGPEENLAFVALVFATLIAIPLLAAGGIWVAGLALRSRAPGLALALGIVSTGIGGLTVLLVALWVVLSLGA